MAPLRLVEQVHGAVEVALGLPHPGHRHPPAVPVLRQAGVLAELRAGRQVIARGVQLVALPAQLAQADVHVRRTAQHRRAVPGRGGQPVLVGGQRVAEPALSDADVGQREGDAESVGVVSGLCQLVA